MNLPVPKGYQLYGGADFSGYPDAEGKIFYSSSAKFPDGKTFGQIVVMVRNGVAEIIPLPEFISSRGQLSWSPAGLFLYTFDVDNNGPTIPKVFQITQFKQFTHDFPIVVTQVNTAVSAVDNQARTDALSAKNLANSAIGRVDDLKKVISGMPNYDQVWQKIEDRFFSFFTDLHNNNRTDAKNTAYADILYSKVNDWIWGKLKETGLLK